MKNRILIIVLLVALHSKAQVYWKEILSNTHKDLNVISFPSSVVGYIGGDDSLLLKSVDGGRTWQELSPTGIQFTSLAKNIIHLEFVDEDRGYLILGSPNPSDLLFRTSDGGQTWIPDSAGICFPKTTYFFDQQTGMAGGAGCFQGEVIDRYANGKWQQNQFMPLFSPGDIRAIDFLDNNFGMATGRSAYVFVSQDGGINWDTARTPVDTMLKSDILVVSDTVAYATYPTPGSSGLLKSSDGGQTWNEEWSHATFFYPGFHAIEMTQSGSIFLGGFPKITPGGFMQHQMSNFWYSEHVDHKIKDIGTYGDSTVFAVGDSGYIITNRDPLFIGTEVENNTTEVSVYPNPTTGEVYIESTETPGGITLMDLNGRNIPAQVIRDGSRLKLDLSAMVPGIYFLRMEMNENIKVRKIIKSN